ncbi:MAG TPA: FAD-dependent oxidoreductase, partial [Henriciella marina]|nr:FAD-dependent oxidoreductase [Henriciella marina]
MSDTYDVVIIGGGPGGYNCAIRCGQLGLKTAIIDKRGVLGGTCLNVGCIPSKALLHGSELFAAAKNDFAGLGIKMSGLELDLDQMMSQKTDAVNGLTQGIEFLMKKNKVDYVKGFGRIKEKGVVEVDGEDGEQKTLNTKNIVIATGSVPSSLPNIEIDEERVVTNEGAIALKEVPEKLIVIGAGIIGLELGSVWSRLGASVTVVEYLDRIMPGADDEIAKEAQRVFKKQGLEFRLGQKVTGVERIDGHVKLFMEPAAGGDQETLEANAIIVAVGRRPYTEGLGLEAVGGKTDKRGVIETTDHFKVT